MLLGHSTFIEIFLFEPTLETEGECGSENWEDSLRVPCSGPEQKHLAGFCYFLRSSPSPCHSFGTFLGAGCFMFVALYFPFIVLSFSIPQSLTPQPPGPLAPDSWRLRRCLCVPPLLLIPWNACYRTCWFMALFPSKSSLAVLSQQAQEMTFSKFFLEMVILCVSSMFSLTWVPSLAPASLVLQLPTRDLGSRLRHSFALVSGDLLPSPLLTSLLWDIYDIALPLTLWSHQPISLFLHSLHSTCHLRTMATHCLCELTLLTEEFVHLPVHPSKHPSILPSLHPLNLPPTHPSTHPPSIHLPTHSLIYLSMHPSILPFIHPFIHSGPF